MLPTGFDLEKDLTYMNIANPANGAVITGQAPTKKVGRQRRRTIALCDEFQVYPYGGYPQYTSLSQTTRSILVLGTPEGKSNKYAQLRFSGHANVFEMDWREHPWKDQRWYDSLRPGYTGPPMTDQQIAQEIDRNYDASQPGKVLGEWDELYHVITWSEFVRYFGRIACGCQIEHDPDIPCRNPHIPFTWNLGRGLDWGTTPGHPCVTIWAARPAERDRLNDSVFVYRELCRPYFPPKAQTPYLVNPRRIAESILAAERRWEETNRITMSILSHEASATQNTFLDPDEPEFNRLRFVKHKAKSRLDGIPQIQNALQINHSQPHPFRRHPVTGESLMGRPRFYLIVADGQGEIFESSGRWLVRPAIDESGCVRLRYEFPLYHYPQTQDGGEKPLPLKRDDDGVDATKHLANVFFPRPKPKTREELIEEQLHPNYRMEHLRNASPEEWDALYPNRQAAIKEIERRERPDRPNSFYDNDESGRLTKSDLDMI
jgi:hypothetical protein